MNKHKFSLFYSLLLICSSVFAQNSLITDWGYSFGNHCGYNSTCLDIKTDLNGNHISTGTIYRTFMSTSTDLDPSNTASFPAGTTYTNDFYIAQYSPAGNFISAFVIGGSGADACNSIAIDNNNNIIATGYFSGTVDFDPSAGTSTALATGTLDAFLAKYSNSGNLIWVKTFPTTASGRGVKVITDNQNNIFLTAYFSGTMDIDPSSTTLNLISNGSNDVCIAKFDASGNLISGKSFGGPGADVSVDMVLDQNKRVFVTGTFNNTVDFDPSPSNSYTLANASSADVYVSKFDSLLSFQWAKAIVNTNVVESRDIEIDNTGNILLTGYFYYTAVDLDMSPTTVASFTTAQSSVFLAKYDNNGNYLWAGTFGNSAMLTGNIGSCIWSDNSGNIYNAGTFGGTIDVDFSASTYTLANGSSGPALYVAKYSAAGTIISASKISSGYIYVFSGHRNANGDMLFCGNMNNPITLFPNTSLPMPNQCGNYFDSYVAKFKECNVPVISAVNSSSNNICPTTGTVMLSVAAGSLNGATNWQWSAGSCLGSTVGTGTSVVVSPSTSMVYYVRGIGGCAGNSLSCVGVTISTLPAPTLSLTSSSSSICPNKTFTLTGSGANTYTWSNGSNASSIAISATASSIYSVSTTGTNGCVGIRTVAVNVFNVQPLLRTRMIEYTTPSSESLDTICSGQNLLIRHAGGSAFLTTCSCTSFTNSGYLFLVFTNLQSTSVYSVISSDPNNSCDNSGTFTINVMPCTGIDEHGLISNTKVYPNPTNNFFKIEANSLDHKNIIVSNFLGQQCARFEFYDSIEIDLSNKPQGVYILSIYRNGHLIETKKIVKN